MNQDYGSIELDQQYLMQPKFLKLSQEIPRLLGILQNHSAESVPSKILLNDGAQEFVRLY